MQERHRTGRASRRLLLRSGALASAAALAGTAARAAAPTQPSPEEARQLVQDWPAAAKAAAEEMLRKYGAPQEMTATLLIWRNNRPWVRSLVHKDSVEHDFPVQHQDVLEQVAEYRVPLNFFEKLARFNGSVLPDRTRGELTAFCDREATNFLALNLAHDVISGAKSVEQARDAMAAGMHDILAGKPPQNAQSLGLPRPQGDLRDPDTPVLAQGQGQARSLGPAVIK